MNWSLSKQLEAKRMLKTNQVKPAGSQMLDKSKTDIEQTYYSKFKKGREIFTMDELRYLI